MSSTCGPIGGSARMKETRAPLVEKMTLFWHGHFATSAQKVKNAYWMWRQNETFRRNALGNFKTLLHEISRDPAMMIYLDLAQSQKQHPNENWAREVMELFTLGIGHYSESDIRESARAFTGYQINFRNQQFRFVPEEHDSGRKNFLGQSGRFSGDDILDLIVQQPACPELIGRKLCRFFVADEPAPPLVGAVASSLRQNNFELRPVLEELFRSAEFYSERVIRAQIKSPVQFLVQSCKLLETSLPPRAVAKTRCNKWGSSSCAAKREGLGRRQGVGQHLDASLSLQLRELPDQRHSRPPQRARRAATSAGRAGENHSRGAAR